MDDGVEPVDSNGTVTSQEDQSTAEQNQSGEQPKPPATAMRAACRTPAAAKAA